MSIKKEADTSGQFGMNTVISLVVAVTILKRLT